MTVVRIISAQNLKRMFLSLLSLSVIHLKVIFIRIIRRIITIFPILSRNRIRNEILHPISKIKYSLYFALCYCNIGRARVRALIVERKIHLDFLSLRNYT